MQIVLAETSQKAGRTLADDIKDVLRRSEHPVKSEDIVRRVLEKTDTTEGSVRTELSKLKKKGEIVSPRYARYSLPEAEKGEEQESEGGLAYEPRNGFDLTIYHSVRPAAGEGNIIYEVDENDAETHKQSKRIFKDLLGFWPPNDMRGMYVDGESMQPGLRDKLLLLYRPVQQMYSGERYILQVEDPQTGDWGLRVKRVVTYAGGGIRIISDNKGLGVPDEELIPNSDNQLINKATGRAVRLHVIGQVLWPTERDREEDVELITRTIEELAGQGLLRQN